MKEPRWANLSYSYIDYHSIVYYASPKKKSKNLNNADDELKSTFKKLGISLNDQKKVSFDFILDSTSIGTTFNSQLDKLNIIFCSFNEAVQKHPKLVKKYLGSVVPKNDNYFAALNSSVFSDGSFCYIPKNVKCPIDLSTYFRINTVGTGQFERTLIVADNNSYVSYLEGCTAPMRDENQLHAAVVEIYASDNSEVKYSTIQN
jgi:Fe-S cluster assembly protein SufB